MQTKKTLLAIIIQLSLSTMALAGDVEIHLPAASDALTVDQPAGTELMRVNGDGNVGIGTAELNSGIFGSGTHLGQQILHKDGTAVLSLESYRDSGNHSKVWATANRGTQASPLPLNAGDFILELNASAFDGTNFDNAARIALGVDDNGTVTPGTSMPGKIVFRTSPDGATSDAERMRIDSAGNVGIGTTEPSDGTANSGQALKLDVEGAVGATHFCDENGENCQTAASLGAVNAGMAMAFKATSSDTTTIQTRNTWYVMDAEWSATPEINTFSNSTFTNGAFTVGAGESGLYEIFARTNIGGDEGRDQTAIFVNSVGVGSSSWMGSAGAGSSVVSSPAYVLANLAEGDVVEVQGQYPHSTTDRNTNCSPSSCYFTLQKIGAAATGGGADNLGNHTATQNIDLAANKLVGNGGTEGVAVAADGKVGIGTNAPESDLHISKASGSAVMKLTSTGSAASDWSGLAFENDTGGNSYIWLGSSTFGSANNDKLVIESSPNHNGIKLNAKSTTDGNIEFFYGGVSQPQVLMQGVTGNVGIGTETPAAKVHIQAPAWNSSVQPSLGISGNRPSIVLHDTNENADDSYSMTMQGGNLEFSTTLHTADDWGYDEKTPVLTLLENGNATLAGTLTQSSDERLKEDIKPVEGALDKITQLQGVTFKWKDTNSKDSSTQLGLIAQQVEKIIPEVVETANDEAQTKSVAYANLVAMLIEGMKEQQQRIEALEAKLQQ